MDTLPDAIGTPAGLLGAGFDAAPDAATLLAQLGQDDPRMAALCRFFVERQAQAAQAPPDTAASPVDGDVLAQLEARLERLRGIARAMKAELHVLRDRDAMLAAALGACDACWGRDAGCGQCAGRGHTGASLPDAPLYARFIAPAVRHLMQARIAHGARPLPDRAVDGPAVGRLD